MLLLIAATTAFPSYFCSASQWLSLASVMSIGSDALKRDLPTQQQQPQHDASREPVEAGALSNGGHSDVSARAEDVSHTPTFKEHRETVRSLTSLITEIALLVAD